MAMLASDISFAAKNPDHKIRMYKYKDKDGLTIIKDHLPTDVVARGYTIVDKYGNAVEVVPPVKTEEQKAEEDRRLAAAKAEQKRIQRQLRVDNDLLRQFTTSVDLERARDNQIKSIQVEIGIRASNTHRIKNQLKKYQTNAANFERRGQPIPKALEDNIKISLNQIEESEAFITIKNNEQDVIRSRFKRDIKRFEELLIQRKRRTAFTSAQRKLASRYSYRCDDLSLCARAWQLTQIYAKEHATGRIDLITDTLIITEKPQKDTDVSITFSRIPDRDKNVEIQMDIICHDSDKGKTLCSGGKIQRIREGFAPFIRDRL
jgi:hypothetical protein